MFRMLTGLGFALLIAANSSAGTISWGPATNTTDLSSISTMGSLVRAFDSGGLGTTVNGVAFAKAGGVGDDVYAAIGSAIFGGFDGNADLADLDALLRTADYVDPPANTSPTVISLTGLASGDLYQIQLFFMDQRGSFSSPRCGGCNDRQMTFTSGPNSVTLDADPENTLASPFGQYVLGVFTADSSIQAFEVTGVGLLDSGTPVSLRQVNAWQLRAVPEPSCVLLLGLVVPYVVRQRRNARA